MESTGPGQQEIMGKFDPNILGEPSFQNEPEVLYRLSGDFFHAIYAGIV